MTQHTGRLARSLEELGANMAVMHGGDRVNFRPLDPQTGDVFITSWAKSGTTLMQQMFHQLRIGAATGAGEMDFDDISRMTPWEDTAPMLDFDMNVVQRAGPRGFKSHREYERLPAGMRYIVTLRDPHETYVSFQRFFEGWHLEPGALSVEEFWPLWMGGGPGGCDYATHLLSWWARRDEADTLLATYRAVVRDRPAMVRRMAGFLGLTLTDDLAALVEEMTSRAFMVAHKDRFDDGMMCAVMEAKLGIPASSDSAKVQAEGSKASALPQSVTQQIDALWAEKIEPVTGHANFASLAEELDARV